MGSGIEHAEGGGTEKGRLPHVQPGTYREFSVLLEKDDLVHPLIIVNYIMTSSN